jgi:predicted NBD/HSP70 family sugar kinase
MCECCRRGCAKAYLSGSSLSRRFFEATGDKLDARAIFERFEAGDPEARPLAVGKPRSGHAEDNITSYLGT